MYLKVIFGILILFIVVLLYACVKASGDADDYAEELFAKMLREQRRN